MTAEEKSQPRAWLCKHCGERVDPTMGLCWSCGYDRLGSPRQDLSSDIEEELMIPSSSAGSLAETIRYRAILLRLAIAGWCVTGLFSMLPGSGSSQDWYRSSRSPADYITDVAFYLSLFLTFALIADLLILRKDAIHEPDKHPSQALHKPWVRGWLTRGWGQLLFWFAWAWLLLHYL